MKKLLIVFLCILSFTGYAQDYSPQTNFESSSQIKGLKPKTKTYLDQVFANPTVSDYGRLMVQIDIKQKIKYDDIVAYINEQNNYTTITIIGNNATQTNSWLIPHDQKAIVTMVLFLKKGDYKNYALKHLAKYAKSKEIINGTNADAFIYTFDNQTQLLTRNNVIWNGSLSNGKISGNGQGYYYNNGTIIYFTGSFKDGYPSDCSFYKYTINESKVFSKPSIIQNNIKVETFGDGLAAFTKPNERYGFIDKYGKIVIKQQYTKVVKPFHDGKAVVWDEKRHSNVIINTNGDFVDYDEEYIYDYNVRVAKASYSKLNSIGKGMFFTYSGGTLIDNFKWSGEVVNGMINGDGSGFTKNDKTFYFISGTFVNGFPKDCVYFERIILLYDNANVAQIDEYEIGFDILSEGMAFILPKGDVRFSLVTEYGKMVVEDEYYNCKPFENGKAEVVIGGNKEIIIDKNGEFVEYTANEKAKIKAIEDAEKARQQRIKDSLDYIAQQKAALERKKAEYERLVAINCNSKLWNQGDHICLLLTEGSYEGKLTCGTLEEWNTNHTKAKIKIVTSPSKNLTYNGELLQKNNTFWIDAKGTRWHKAVKGEFEETLTYDNSIKGPDVIYQQVSSPSSGPHRYDDCDYCKGSGKLECPSCGGDGYCGWNNDEYCTSCKGRGMERCYHCHGTGRK